ncbi:hypothetical protein FHL15_011331 [Xylaria flabelliformis]|uniref:Uncharacterized protein n=1 Tax=Xylaria flabelliformis TaxID=2512241 RepID=A0A553HIK9_9PEZI|nr:hypothetical protein FHL15_011331 [Xylaria flabelliformis]
MGGKTEDGKKNKVDQEREEQCGMFRGTRPDTESSELNGPNEKATLNDYTQVNANIFCMTPKGARGDLYVGGGVHRLAEPALHKTYTCVVVTVKRFISEPQNTDWTV